MKSFSYDQVKIDKRSSLKISFQLAQAIKLMLLNHEITHHELLPSIHDMSDTIKVRKTDVEEAYQMLIDEKFVTKQDGKHHVNYFHFSANFFLDVVPLIDAIRQMGMVATTKTIYKKVVSLPTELHTLPQVDVENKYLCIKRLYYGNDVPLVILEMYMPYPRFKDLDLNVNNHEGIYEYIYKEHNIKVSSSTRTFKVVNIDKENAKLLNMLPHTASYQGISIAYDQHKKMVDITRSWSIINYFFEMEYSKEDIDKIVAQHLFFI